MEVVTGLAVLFAQFGAKKVVAALLGEGSGDIAEGLVKLVTNAEDTTRRLTAIEKKLDMLLDQRFQVAYSAGVRYLTQTLVDPTTRAADIARAEELFVEAAHAGVTSFDRAMAERMLLMIRLARGQQALAADSVARLDVLLGDAAQDQQEGMQTEDTRAEQIHAQQVGPLGSMQKAIGFRSAGLNRISHDLLAARSVRGAAIQEMFGDCGAVAALLGSPSPTNVTLKFSYTPWDSITVNTRYGVPARAGGIECLILAPQWTGAAARAHVQVSSRRSRPVPVVLNDPSAFNPRHVGHARVRTLGPGEGAELQSAIDNPDVYTLGIRFSDVSKDW